jgi:hypothetical protein
MEGESEVIGESDSIGAEELLVVVPVLSPAESSSLPQAAMPIERAMIATPAEAVRRRVLRFMVEPSVVGLCVVFGVAVRADCLVLVAVPRWTGPVS